MTMKMRRSHKSFWASLSILLIITCHSDVVRGETTTCDACFYDGKDPDDCKDYGTINGDFIPWTLGAQECFDNYKITITSLDPTIICSSANAFVNDLKSGSLSSSTAKLGLGTSEGSFFEQDASNNNAVKIKAEITIGGKTYNCATSQSDCYNAMKPYFKDDPEGQKEMMDVCSTLYNKVRVDRQLEQSVLRIRLCDETKEDPTSIPASCGELSTEVAAKMKEYPDTACSGFGFGTGNSTIPGCEDRVATESGDEGGSASDGNASNGTNSSAGGGNVQTDRGISTGGSSGPGFSWTKTASILLGSVICAIF